MNLSTPICCPLWSRCIFDKTMSEVNNYKPVRTIAL
jgi:hypothetical protein